ncbi:Phagocyte signaling-impaired protein, partial [Orchesella cincta]
VVMNGDLNAEAARLRERKLRFLYELVDSENNKKVITEVDRLLKKQPGFTCAKILKALALIRMQKTVEAKEILDLVIKEVPVDDGSIQALSICYKELDDHVTMSKVFEAASKKLPSEELMTHSFMAQVRTNEFQKMQLTALNLYKMYSKPTYFGWAVASLLIKADKLTPADSGRPISLTLAERMLGKFISEVDKTQVGGVEESILLLYLETLSKQKKWEEVLTALKDFIGYPDPSRARPGTMTPFMITEEYHLIQRIITLFKNDEEIGPEVKSLLDELLTKFQARVRADLQMACKFGAEKPSFYTDMIPYVNSPLLSSEMKEEFMQIVALHSKHDGDQDQDQSIYSSVRDIIRDVNYELLDRDLFPDPGPLQRKSRAERCLLKYFSADSISSSLRSGSESDKNLITKEADYHDQFLVIAASTLMAKYDDDENDFDGVLSSIRSSKPEEIPLENLNLDENPQKSSYSLSDQDYLLMTAILLMEFGLKQCPYNHSLRILLIKAYTRIGAVQRACVVSTGLDIKHVQWDSLGFLIIWKVLRGGLYAISRQMLTVAESVYLNYKRDCMEHLITAYKFGSFGKIQEFEGFREQLLNSCQFGLIQVEKQLLQLSSTTLSSATNHPQVKISPALVAKSLEVEKTGGEDMFWKKKEFTDNRDFTILSYLESNQKPFENLKAKTGETDVELVKIRRALLVLLAETVVLVEEEKNSNPGRLERIDEALSIIREKTGLKMDGNCENVPYFNGLWPPAQLQYFEMGCLSTIVEMVGEVRKAIGESGAGASCLVSMSSMITSFWSGVKTRLTEKMSKLTILTMGGCIEDIHHVVETFSFACILFGVAIKAGKTREASGSGTAVSATSSRRKKKAASDAASKAAAQGPPPDFAPLKEVHSSLRDLIMEFRLVDICSIPPRANWHWSTAQKEWEGLLSDKLKEKVFAPAWDEVQQGIVDSYGLQLDQFMRAVDNNSKFVTGMETSSAQ